jgi:lipopolysaccharide transport system ATP-binding protein
MGKMGEISKRGKTVFFVSHNMLSISKLCEKTLILDRGKIKYIGETGEAINQYFSTDSIEKGYANTENSSTNRQGPKLFSKILGITTMNKDFEITNTFNMGEKLYVKIEFEILKPMSDIELTFYFIGFNNAIYGVYSSLIEGYPITKKGIQAVIVEIPSLNLLPGNHSIGVWITRMGNPQDDMIAPVLEIDVLSNNFLTGNPVDYNRYKHYGVLNRSHWQSAE